MLVPAGSSVKVIEVESGAVVKILSLTGASAGRSEITQIIVNPLKAESEIISCSVDGTISVWDWVTGQQIRGFRTKHPMHSMILKSHAVSENLVELFIVSLRLKGPLGCNLPDSKKLFNYCNQRTTSLIEHVRLDMSTGAFKIKQIFKARGMSRLAINLQGTEMVFNSREEIHFCPLNGEKYEISRTLKHSSAITRLQYHPTEPCLVLSDRHGQIVMWYCLELDAGKISSSKDIVFPQRTLHWHANEVTDMAFTSNGQNLLSGGEEAVLVLWQIESGLKQYLPRLGDPIHYVTVSGDDCWAAVSTRDNMIHLVSLTTGSTLAVTKSIRGCSLRNDEKRSKTSKMTCVPLCNSSSLLLSGNPGNLQIYDPIKDSVERVIEVAPQNRPTSFAGPGKKVLEVVRTAVSICGKWMVTLEQRNSHNPLKTILTTRLKFWGSSGDEWTLLSMVDRPHGDLVTDLCIWKDISGIPFAASSSRDGTFKVWSINLQHGIWNCCHVGSYHDLQGGASSVSVNFDRSLLAVVYGAAVCIWRLSDYCLINVLMTTQSANLSEARFLSNGSLIAWCPETGTFAFNEENGKLCLSWHSPISPKVSVAIYPIKAEFAMIIDSPTEEHTGVLTYAIDSPVPIGFYLLPLQCVDFHAVVYVPSPEVIRKIRPSEAEGHILVLLDGLSGEFTLLGTENASKLNRSDFNLRIKPGQINEKDFEASRQRAKSLYCAIFESEDGLTKNPNFDSKAQGVKHSMAELFSAVPQFSKEDLLLPLVASHVLPPVGMLFAHYIQKIIKKRN